MYRKLLPILDEDITALTANRRLSQHLRQQYDQYQATQQHPVWETPNILPLNTWLAHCWQHHPECQKYLLSDLQEHLLWQKIIRESEYAELTWHTSATASLVQQAWQTLKLWKLSLKQMTEILNDETKIFLAWAKKFESIKQTQQYISSAELPTLLSEFISNNTLTLPKKIALVGFDELSPSIQQLFDQVKLKTEVITCLPTKQNIHIRRVQLTDEESEILTMARWSKKQLDMDHSQKIGCIVPDLAKNRKMIERIFVRVFSSGCTLTHSNIASLPYNISAGQQLNTFLIVQTALSILQMNRTAVKLEHLSRILLSPYLNSNADESCASAMLDVQIRNQNQLLINPNSLLPLLADLSNNFPASTLYQRWQAFLKSYHQGVNVLPSQWAAWFHEELFQIGWPGQRLPNSHEYQLYKRWEALLEEFSQLDFISSAISRRQALQMLNIMAQQIIFQPQSADVPIQILGTLEASGCEFDALWITGLNNENWPPPAKPNPFLPIAIQRQYHMPHASAERELKYTKQLQQRLFTSAPRIQLSSTNQAGDKRLMPSYLIQSIPEIDVAQLELPHYEDNIERVFKSKDLETMVDNQAPHLQTDELIQGGSQILQQQSLCPFRAFASIRLQAENIKKPQLGLVASDRGILAHKVLEIIWHTIKTQEKLLTYSEKDLQSLIQTSVDTTLNEYRTHKSAFVKIEKKRLTKLLTEWLNFEKTRPSFEVIQRETIRHIKIHNLAIKLKIDRIDKLTDGTHLVIDYKTKLRNNIYDWFGERPEDLQLPLYCIYGLNNATGLAYAQVKNGHMKFKGIIANEKITSFSDLLPLTKLKTSERTNNWQQLTQRWHNTLQRLSIDFSLGKAEVDPINPATTCQYCDLHTLCRIGARQHE